jgi:hypothetical protein
MEFIKSISENQQRDGLAHKQLSGRKASRKHVGLALAKGATVIATLALLAPSALAAGCPDNGRDPYPHVLGSGTGQTDCWTGTTYATGTTVARTYVTLVSGVRKIQAYKFSGAPETAYARGYDSSYNLVCSASDTSGNGVSGTAVSCPSNLFQIFSVAGSAGLQLLNDWIADQP